jgi:hypothetical protein
MNMDNNSKVSSVNQTTSLLIASTPFSSFATSIRSGSVFYFMTKISSNDKIRLGYGYGFKDLLIL